MIKKIKKYISTIFCDHQYKLISTTEDKLSLYAHPNELLIYKCIKCGKIKLDTISIKNNEVKKINKILDKE